MWQLNRLVRTCRPVLVPNRHVFILLNLYYAILSFKNHQNILKTSKQHLCQLFKDSTSYLWYTEGTGSDHWVILLLLDFVTIWSLSHGGPWYSQNPSWGNRAPIQLSSKNCPENCPELWRHISTSDFWILYISFWRVFGEDFRDNFRDWIAS